jgi:hypothetical protein
MAAEPALLASLLRYHVLSGTYYASSFTNQSAFIPTLLTNPTYTNVTGGQRVEAILQGGNATLYSALKENSTVVTPVSAPFQFGYAPSHRTEPDTIRT